MIDTHGRDVAHTKEIRGFDSAMSCNDAVRAVDEHGIDEPELLNAGSDLLDLLCGVSAGVFRSWPEGGRGLI